VKIRRSLLPTLALGAAAATVLAGCASGSDTETATDAGDSASSAGFPIEIDNAFGTTVIESQPENVAAIAWGNQDVALALGVAPVGMPFITYADDNGDGILPWVQDALDELGAETPVLYDEVDGVNFEQVADTAPDVILAANSGVTEEDYETLTEIAPTVSYPGSPWIISWRDSTTTNGAALGLEDEADDLIAETESVIEDAITANPELEGKSFAYIYLDPSDTSAAAVYLPGDTRIEFVKELGLVASDGVTELAEQNEGQFYASLTSENLDMLADADIIVNYGSADTLAAMQADPLIGSLPAVQRGSVVIIDNADPLAAAFTTPTVLSIPWGIDEYMSLLSDAASKVQ